MQASGAAGASDASLATSPSLTTSEDNMTLHRLGKDPESPNNGSPTVYLDDETGNYILQGWRVTDAERLAQMDIPDHETVIEFPRRMMQFFPEVNDGGGIGV
ncbi:hypothetical protein GCM10010145_24730 [Streptomyces ruber]|uniref:Uncharacterized protein n=3 Tax=Streptomyces TaxID=1883 RepID=A0A918BAV5_9ACTN|nr:hypothetical protein GCM10010145_24730 [Streptomyces ruber]